MLPADAQKMLRVEPSFERLERTRNERAAPRKINARLISFRFEKADFAHAHQPAAVVVLQKHLIVFAKETLRRNGRVARVGMGSPSILQTFEDARKTGWFDRLQEIIERAEVESFQRLLIVSGREDDERGIAQLCEQLEATAARHLHIKKDQVGFERANCLFGLRGICRFPDDRDFRMSAKQAPQLGACETFVVDEQRFHLRPCSKLWAAGITMRASTQPRSGSLNSSEACSEKSNRKRVRKS